MIYVVEIPHEGRPFSWFAFDRDDLARKVRAAKESGDTTVFAALSARLRLRAAGLRRIRRCQAAQPAIFDDADRYGWDTVLYRPITPEPRRLAGRAGIGTEACVAALAHERKPAAFTCRTAVRRFTGPMRRAGRFYAHMSCASISLRWKPFRTIYDRRTTDHCLARNAEGRVML